MLEQVGGGVTVGTTSYGYPVDDKGNVTFTDKTGETMVFTSAQWEKLKSNYTHAPGNPEAYLSTVSLKELKEANIIPSNPLGV